MYSSAFLGGNGAAQTQQRKLFLCVGSSLLNLGWNGRSQPQKAPAMVHGDKLHQHKDARTDLWWVCSVWLSADIPQGDTRLKKKKAFLGDICSTGSIREEKFGLGQENRWKAALLFKVEVNTRLFKMHLFC